MALTFDDLPYVAAGYEDTVQRGREITAQLLQSLGQSQVPATAFVNESRLYVDDQTEARIDLLKRWVEYGAALGNHTYSHSDLNDLTVAEFQREIVNGERVTRILMASRKPYERFFRHPYTHTGNTEEKKAEVSAFLHERSYQIAPYTVDSQDYLFNRVYLDAKKTGNEELALQVQGACIDFVVSATEFAEGASVKLFGNEIRQTLILHADDISAGSLGDLLGRLEERGYEFVNLADAMRHPAYKTEDTLVTRFGPSWLWRWAESMGAEISFAGDPEPPDWILSKFEDADASER